MSLLVTGAMCLEHKMGQYDAVYIARVKGKPNLYKIGQTQLRRGIRRIQELEKTFGVEFELVMLTGVDDATRIEAFLLEAFGCKAKAPKLAAGWTEFRKMSEQDLNGALKFIDSAVNNTEVPERKPKKLRRRSAAARRRAKNGGQRHDECSRHI